MDESVSTADAQARVAELERTLESLREDSEVAYVLLGLSGALAEVRSLEETIALAVRTIPGLFGADRCLAATWDAAAESFDVLAHWGYEDADVAAMLERAEAPHGFPVLRKALQERTPVFESAGTLPPDEGILSIPLIRWGEDFGGLRLGFSRARTFTARDSALARGVARQLGVALDNARRFNLLRGLRGFGLRVGSQLRLAEVIEESVAGTIDLLVARGAWLYFLDSTHKALVTSGGRSGSLALPERLARVDLSEEPWAGLLRGETISLGGVGDHFGSDEALEVAAAPLATSENSFMGALLVVHPHAQRLGTEELQALGVLAGQVAQAVENARRFDRERSVARKLQAGLLTTEMPDLGASEIGAVYEAADDEAEVGGDFYDVIELEDDRFGLVVGDVSGKGAEAAAQTAVVKYMLRAFALRNPAPASALYDLNNALARDLAEDRFVTLMYAVFDPRQRRCSIAVAGHPPPLIYRRDRDEVDQVDTQGPIMGAFEDQRFEHVSAELAGGDVFLAYTDGLLEARSGEEFFGLDRIRSSLQRHARRSHAAEMARHIYEDARRFGQINDDTVVFVLAGKDRS